MNTPNLPKTFEGACALILNATHPQQIFGQLLVDNEAAAKRLLEVVSDMFRSLAFLVHPDKNLNHRKKAEETFKKLGSFKDQADAICERAIPKPEEAPTFKPVTFSTKKFTYIITEPVADGGVCGVFRGVLQNKARHELSVVIKVPHNAEDNDLLEREARALKLIRRKASDIAKDNPGAKVAIEKFTMRIPTIVEVVQLEEPGKGKKKAVNVFTVHPDFEDGWYTLEEIRREYPKGIDSRLMCFIWNRVLEGLTLAHASGIVHCAITPNHVLVHAKSHMGMLIDWTAACRIQENDKVPYIDEARYGAYFPDELKDPSGAPSPATDIYMSAWSMVYLLGGNPLQGFIPDTVEGPIREFLNKCLQPNRRMRPQSADAAYKEFQQIAKALWGKRKFVELPMPARK